MWTLCLVFATLTLLLDGCWKPTPRLGLILTKNYTVEDMIRNAEIIVIGKVESQKLIGPIVEGYRLVKVGITVENAIQGTVTPTQPLTFYFYWPYLYGTSGDVNSLQDEHRYVFFLKRDNGVLRAVWDLMRSNIIVSSGRHNVLPLPEDRPLTERISVMLLTPGDDLNPGLFSNGLLRSTPLASFYIGSWRTANLLRSLLRSPDRAVRVGACEELSLQFLQDSCWNDLDIGDGSDLRYHHGIITPRVSRKGHQYLIETRDPESWWEQTRSWYSTEAEHLNALKLLTIDDNSSIREKFCVFLRTKFPGEVADSGCPKQ
jgi:hypothetical protein